MLQFPENFTTALTYIGAATTCYLGFQLAGRAYWFIRSSSLPRYNPPGKDSWALVTGATDGIGFGFAQALSRRGFNVFLHGRNREKLLRRQQELQAQFPSIKTKIIVYDVIDITEEVDNIVQEIGDAPLTVLINNVGGSLSDFQKLPDKSYTNVRDTISLNITFMTQVTRLLIPILEKNGPGLIMNISSVASYGMPWVSVYSGCKGYVDTFTKAVASEMKVDGRPIEVLGICVGNVQSQTNAIDVSWTNPSSLSMAESALNRVGSKGPMVWGYLPHALQGLGFVLIPRDILIMLIVKTMGDLEQDWAKRR
ncbi:short chain dehydrogenase reductase [Aspergillus sclerotialis]|uniref:Short chain dehydrogenase reductase n=1 Tax=Aspergillus sclerotialis TaxID=2070753 RepID=A0A3A2ZHB4_9EURO|nr:short chain dehydrogenase reductase [Aspergillus sclerotialis]